MKNSSEKLVQKVSKNQTLAKFLAATVFGVGFVAPLTFANIAQAGTDIVMSGSNKYNAQFSNADYVGFNGEGTQGGNIGGLINSITTATSGVDGKVRGIYLRSVGGTITSLSGGINVKSTSNKSYGISYGDDAQEGVGTGKTSISGVQSITAETSGAYYQAYGILSSNGNSSSDTTFSVTMTNGGSISAYSANGQNYGICFWDGTGTSQVLNVHKITAGVKGENITTSDATGIYVYRGTGTVTFAGENTSIVANVAKTNKSAYGIQVQGGTLTVTGLSGITVSSNANSSKLRLQGGTLNLENSTISADDGVTSVYANDTGVLNLKNSSSLAGAVTVGKTTIYQTGTLNINVDEGSSLAGDVTVDTGSTLNVNVGENSTWQVGTVTKNGVVNATNTGGTINFTTNGVALDSLTLSGGTLTIGTGTKASSLTVTNGISVASGNTGALVGGSTTNISTLTGAVSNAGELSISNLNISNAITNTGTLNAEKVIFNANVSDGTLNVAGGLTKYAGTEAIGAKTVIKSGGQLDPAANLLNADTTVESGGELYLSSGTLSVGIKGTGTTYLQASPSVDEDQTITVNSSLTIDGTLNGSSSTIDMIGGEDTNKYTTLTVGNLQDTTNLKIDLDMSNVANVDKMSIGAVNTSGTVLNLSDINITADYVVASAGTLTLPTTVNNGIIYVAQTGGYNSENLTYQVNGATGSLAKNSIATNRYIYTFTLGEAGKLNYEITAASGDVFKDFIEGKIPNVPQTLSLTDDLADATASMANNTYDELTININDGKKLGTATGNVVTIANEDTLNLNGGASAAGIVYTGWNVAEGGTLNLGGKLQLNGAITGAGTTEIKGNVDLNGGTITQKTIKMDTANASLDKVGVLSGNESNSKIELTAGSIGTIGTVYGGYSQFGSATSNAVTMSGGSVTGNVYGGFVYWGDANTGNSVTITGGTYGGSIFGGYSNKDVAGGNRDDLGNEVSISGETTSDIKAIYGGHGNGASYNKVTIENSYSGTVTQDGRELSVAGGYSIGGGDSVHNNVSIASGTYENCVSGGYAYTTSGTGTGNGNNNTITLSGGTFKSEVFGGYAAGEIGNAESNSVSITGTIEAVKLFGGYSVGGAANKNSVTISDANAKITNLQVLVGGQGVNAGGENNGNTVTISNGEISCVDNSQILGGLSTSTNGVVSYNRVSISGGKIKAAVTGGTVTQIAGGISTTGSVKYNVLAITGGELQDVYYLNGAYGNVSVDHNELNISNATITGAGIGTKLTAGSSDNGTATDNVLNISSGTLDEVNTIRGGHGITATDNVVNISGGSIDGISDGMEIFGGKTTTDLASGNKVNISNGSLTNVKAIYGGYSDSGNVTGNKVNISGGTFGGNIYGGYSEQGTTSGNTITITRTEATYLGSGLMQADSAVTLGNGTDEAKLTVGNGADTAALTFVSGLNILNEGELVVTNNASVTLQSTSTLAGAVTGAGELIVNGGTATAGAALNLTGGINLATATDKLIIAANNLQSDVVNAGTVELMGDTLGDYDIVGGALAITGDVTADVKNLQTTQGITNESSELTLTGNAALADAITGAGSTVIDGAITSGKNITQTALTVKSDKSLYMDAVLTAATTVEENGVLTISASNMKGTVANAGTLKLNAGTLDAGSVITGTGVLNILGDVTSYANITQGMVLNAGGVLTMEGGAVLIAGSAIAPGATLNSSATSLKGTVEDYGTLEITGGTLKDVEVHLGAYEESGTVVAVGKMVLTNDTDGYVKFAENSVLTQVTDSLIQVPAALIDVNGSLSNVTVDKAMFQTVASSEQLQITEGKLQITGADGVKKWDYYPLVSGEAVTNGDYKYDSDTSWQLGKLWKLENIQDDKGSLVTLAQPGKLLAEYVITGDTVALEIRNIASNLEKNTSALGGVQSGAISMMSQISDAIGDNLTLRNRPAKDGKYEKTIWASYINSKDSTEGMRAANLTGNNNDASYHGVTLGADVYASSKAITGVALTYATGDVRGNTWNTSMNNKTKYYGLSLYNRITNGHSAWTYDLGYSRGDNDIDQFACEKITGDAKTDALTAGVKFQQDYNFKHSALTPFVSARYIRLQNKDYSNSNGSDFSFSNQNLIQPKVGLVWTGNFKMPKCAWNFKPVAEIGYRWNLGDRDVTGDMRSNGRTLNLDYETADRSAYYGKLGLGFTRKNFTGSVSYHYSKGDSIRNNKWNVNLSWSF